ncbi:MAG: hypothetical protein NTW96_17580 [Planctomycetia bacterium]|nr:hypothetical protein [Planctomycetia bacterium]
MANDPREHHDGETVEAGPSSRWGLGLWVAACAAFGLPLAWVSTAIGQHYAPLLLFPFATGAVVGACLVGAMRVGQMHRRGIATLAAVLTGLVVVLGQHYFSYLSVCRRIDEEAATYLRARQIFGQDVQGSLPTKPAGLLAFLQHEATHGRELATSWGNYTARGRLAWLSWAVDAVLVLLGAVVIVRRASRRERPSPTPLGEGSPPSPLHLGEG